MGKYKDPEYQKKYRVKHREYINEQKRQWRKLHPWVSHYIAAKQRCTNPKATSYAVYGGRGINFCLTMLEIKSLWFRDKAWLLKQPSIDRIDSNKDYTIENCQFIEMLSNSQKSMAIQVAQYTLTNKLIKVWPSSHQAAKVLSVDCSNLLKAMQLGRPAHGFYWRKI